MTYNPENNLLLMTDSYKLSHWLQYPPGTEYVFSYIESRGGKYDKTVVFGLQMFLLKYMTKPITVEDVLYARDLATDHGMPFNFEGWMYIVEHHKGVLPVEINAVPEGTILPVKNAIVTIVNTDPKCFWLTSYLETALLRAVWYPTTVATNSYHIKQLIKQYLEETGDVGGLDYKLHDFGARGVSSHESAGIGGLAHTVNFKGSDTIESLVTARLYYNEKMSATSIPAAEHSTTTSWGRNREVEAYANMIDKFAGNGKIYAIVSDSYDIYNAVDNIYGDVLRNKIRMSGGTLVVRPDSGDPAYVVLKVIKKLWNRFGGTKNAKGFKVLAPCVRVIQGDGINYDSIKRILQALKTEDFSADNIAFGMGGALLQGLDRDTQKFAMKCSAICINGEWKGVSKDPITDADKKSKEGYLTTIRNDNGSYETYDLLKGVATTKSIMHQVYIDGNVRCIETLESIRSRSNQ